MAMKARAKILFNELRDNYNVHPFIIEFLDVHGFDTTYKLQLLKGEYIDEMVQKSSPRLKMFKHLKSYDPDLYKRVHLELPFHFDLKKEDRLFLEDMEERSIEIATKIEPELKKFPQPRYIPGRRRRIEE